MHARLSWFRILGDLVHFLCLGLRSRASLAAENLFLRKQLAFYQEHETKPRRLTDAARITLVFWSRWLDWKQALAIVRPQTLIRWHCRGFQLFWRWKSKPGRPRLPRNIRELIAEMARENLTWGQGRVAAAFDALVALAFRCSGVRALARATPPLRPIREK